MIVVNQEIWKSFLDFFSTVINKEKVKHKNKEMQAEVGLKKKVGLIGEEFTKKWEALPPDTKVILAGMSKDDFAKHTSSLKSFNGKQFTNEIKSTTKSHTKGTTISLQVYQRISSYKATKHKFSIIFSRQFNRNKQGSKNSPNQQTHSTICQQQHFLIWTFEFQKTSR